MWESFRFWLMKPLAEAALWLTLLAVVLLIYGLASLPGYLKQRRCKHEQVREDGACNAWCSACGKNLGFIGTWREKRRA
jgi:hypothetical protein